MLKSHLLKLLNANLCRQCTRQLIISSAKPATDLYDNIPKTPAPRIEANHFELVELIQILEKENVQDIFVCKVPREYRYVDYMVICSGYSYRSMSALSQIVRHQYKNMNKDNINTLPKIEGAKSKEWLALDLGNIALHIFSPRSRINYNLEELWSIGQHNTQQNKT